MKGLKSLSCRHPVDGRIWRIKVIRLNTMRSQSGFGLIEVMVAIVVLSVGLLGAAMMQANMTSSTNLARQRGDALFLAKDKLEVLRGASTCDVSLSENSVSPYQGSAVFDVLVACAGEVATITVTWTDAASEVNTVELQSQI